MRRYLLTLIAILGAVVGVVVLSVFRSPTLGLDLQGGLAVVLEAEAPKGQQVDRAGMDRSVEIMRNRIDRLGVSEPEIRRQGEDQIIIELPGVHDAGRAADIVGQTARLEFYDLQENAVPPTKGAQTNQIVPTEELQDLLTVESKLEEGEEPTAWYLFSASNKLLAGPAPEKADLAKELPNGKVPAGAKYYAVPEERIVLTCGVAEGEEPDENASCPGVNAVPTTTYYYLYEYRPTDEEDPVPQLTGSDLNIDGTQADFVQGRPVVNLQFTGGGGDKFHDITRELARRGRQVASLLGIPNDAPKDVRQQALQSFAIVLDGEIRSYPTIDYVDNPDGIAGGMAFIEGNFTTGEAKDLALVLQTGALPYSFTQLERTDISATLGEDSLQEAKVAAIVGILAVALFLLVAYRFLGVVAIIGLGVYGVFLYGTILAFNVTMTLPGFAGLILTIGVAADANIVIFERIKEEVRAGKSVRAAIATGYTKGFSTIIDGNVVTMITAAVLFLVGTGSVKGFALMLLLGTALSMVTAVLATRAMLGALGRFRWFENPAFMGASGQKIPDWQKIDFIGKRKIWFGISTAAIAICLVSLGVQGLNLGIDFRGGSQATFTTAEPISVNTVREEAAALGLSGAVIQGRGPQTDGGYESFSLRAESLDLREQSDLEAALQSELGAQDIGFKNVSASFSRVILKNAIIAVIVSLILVALYVTIRYQFSYAVPVLVALFHDLLIAIGVYSLSGREVTASSVAALLTILGYSIYDTIIIFDRVRENVQLMKRSSFAAIANQSLWETIRRSLATTFITLLPVASLLIFGGDTLKDFAFAIFVGVAAGAYSTIFIATPLLAVIKQREPEYEKRKDVGHVEKLDDDFPLEPGPEPEPEPDPARPSPTPGPLAGGPAVATAGAVEPPPTDAAARRAARSKRRRGHGRR